MTKFHNVNFLAALVSVCCITTVAPCAASPDAEFGLDALSQFEYDPDGPFAIGDTIDSTELSRPRQRCIDFDEKDVKSDSAGAVSSSLKVSIVRDLDDLEKEFNFSYSYQASAKASLLDLAGGSASFNAAGQLKDYLKEAKESILISIEAYAHHGKDYIPNYPLSSPYKALIDTGNFREFQKQCGTHFIRAVTRVSKIRVNFKISQLSSSAKQLITQQLGTSGHVNVGIDNLNAEGKSEIAANLSAAFATAKQFGQVSIDTPYATGGAGIPALSAVLSGINLSNSVDIAKLLDGFVQASATFTRANAAPNKFVIIPYPDTAGISPPFNVKQYDRLGGLFRALLRIDEQLNVYNNYKIQDINIWTSYFKIPSEALRNVRKQVVDAFINCKRSNQCEKNVPDIAEGVYLKDVLYAGNARAVCPRSYEVTQAVNPASNTVAQVISSIIITWQGKFRYANDLDLIATDVYRVTPALNYEKIDFKPTDYIRTKTNSDRSNSIYIFVYSRIIDPLKIKKEGDINYEFIRDVRKDVARSIYGVKFYFKNGVVVDQPLGFPDMSSCVIEAPYTNN